MFKLTPKRWTKPLIALALGSAVLAPTAAFARVHDARDDHDRGRDYDRDHGRDQDRDHDRDRHPEINIDLSFGLGHRDYPPSPARHTERVWVDPVYRTTCDRIWIEAEYRTVCDHVWVDAVTQDVCERVWVDPVYDVRDVEVTRNHRRVIEHQRVLVTPGHEEERTVRKVIVEGHWQDVERREVVRDGYWSNAERQELVTPGHWEDRVVDDCR